MRGHGLFIAIEPVKPVDGAPDVDLARRVINRLKARGCLARPSSSD
jgi:4-aminobutyrate aminotransferase-like enzyme